jgi:ribosomal protein L11 methyltransferase
VVVTVPATAAEEARARMLELLPEGFEEVERGDTVDLAGYVGHEAESRIRTVFAVAVSEPVAADWPDRWRSFHRPVRIGPLWVGPPWESAPDDAIAVVIDPGRAFGTGAHPSTRLALELLLDLDPAPLIDIGCGSGVLAIAAAKLGFTVVEASDVDPVAADIAAANAARNGVEFPIRVVEALSGRLPRAEIAVANIAFDVVERLARRLETEMLVASGYLETEETELAGLRHVRRRTADGWAADLYRRD